MVRTRDEYEAAAMLIGVTYDQGHHLFFTPHCEICYDPDTMEIVYQDHASFSGTDNNIRFSNMLKERRLRVESGELPQEVTNA